MRVLIYTRIRRVTSPLYSRLAVVGIWLVTVLLGVSFPAAQAGATTPPSASLAISATSGPVGSVIRVSGTYSSASFCEGVEFRETGANQNGYVELFPAQAANGSFAARLVIPSYLGSSGSGTGIIPVQPGTYQVALVPGVHCAATSPPPPLTFHVTSTAVPPGRFVAIVPTPDGKGYWLAQAGGGVYSFGNAGFFGSVPGLGITPAAPIVGMAATADGRGYWLVGADGGVFAFGDAPFDGSAISPPSVAVPFAAISRPARATGYYAEAVIGKVVQFGTTANSAQGVEADAFFSGLAITPDGQGVWQVGTDGGVFAWGNAGFYGSLPGEGIVPNSPVVGIASTPDARGYWLLGADGGVFAFGDAGFFGSGTS